MSGQYPPPNPAHPYSRVPHPASQRVMPPWGHPSQPTPGLNLVGSGMSYFGAPHAGLRGTQPWAEPPPSHKPPADARPASANPLFGLQMLMADNATRIPTEYQQKESMDLSSHTVAKPTAVPQEETESSDLLRNGTIAEVNGEVRTESSGENVTSVIAANPLREGPSDSGVSDRAEEEIVIKPKEEVKPERDSEVRSFGSVVKTTSSITPEVVTSVNSAVRKEEVKDVSYAPTEVDRIREFIMKVDKPDDNLEAELDGMYGFENTLKSADSLDASRKLDWIAEARDSFHDSSALSVDTDESKLVVAESSAEDIFGISPVGDSATSVLYENDKSKDSKQILSSDTFPSKSEVGPSPPSLTEDKPPVNNVTPANETQPQPSVENVEILLESMFNSQEENSCSSQTSSGIPQSVIVSSGAKTAMETPKPSVELVSPMKVEDLASTLAEDTPVKSKVKEETEESVTDDVMHEIEKKLEMLTESVSDTKVNEVKDESETEKEPVNNAIVSIPSNKDNEAQEEETSLGAPEAPPPAVLELPTQNAKAGSSNNPFIEVESELEKMFAGIVEEGGSESQTQNSTSEPKKDANKRTVVKRKKANNRRPSDCSVFGGGSSGESTPVKKRGRKRASEVGSDRSGKKVKLDGEAKKKRLPKDIGGELGGKVRGPFVHIEGPKESPTSVVVVNSGVRPDEEDVQKDKSSARRKHSSVHRAEGVASRKAYSSSTLSARYNSESADLTWVCALCRRGPHCDGGLGGEPAGDLFGPYRVPAMPPADNTTHGAPSDRDVVDEQRRRGGKYPKSLRTSGGAEGFVQRMGKKSKRSQSMESVEGPGLLPVEDGLEVWLHGACAEWAPGLCVVGTSLVGLDDAVWTAVRTRCVACGEPGAGVGCVVRSCPAAAHVPCARLAGWLLDRQTFIARCHHHRTMSDDSALKRD